MLFVVIESIFYEIMFCDGIAELIKIFEAVFNRKVRERTET